MHLPEHSSGCRNSCRDLASIQHFECWHSSGRDSPHSGTWRDSGPAGVPGRAAGLAVDELWDSHRDALWGRVRVSGLVSGLAAGLVSGLTAGQAAGLAAGRAVGLVPERAVGSRIGSRCGTRIGAHSGTRIGAHSGPRIGAHSGTGCRTSCGTSTGTRFLVAGFEAVLVGNSRVKIGQRRRVQTLRIILAFQGAGKAKDSVLIFYFFSFCNFFFVFWCTLPKPSTRGGKKN